jgi:hypothetical protein
MARIVVIFSSLWLAACDVGELPGLTGDGGADASGNGCDTIAATIPTGHHNPPMTTGCMSAAGCHNQALGLGTGAPEYSYAGMLYKADKVTPYGGATIVVKLGSAVKKTVASDNGEFYMVPGVAGIDPPTNTQPMVGALTQGGGDCNKGGCHTPGVGQGAIYLP